MQTLSSHRPKARVAVHIRLQTHVTKLARLSNRVPSHHKARYATNTVTLATSQRYYADRNNVRRKQSGREHRRYRGDEAQQR